MSVPLTKNYFTEINTGSSIEQRCHKESGRMAVKAVSVYVMAMTIILITSLLAHYHFQKPLFFLHPHYNQVKSKVKLGYAIVRYKAKLKA